MSFSFSTTAGASQGVSTKRLAGNKIYTVKFDGCEIQDIKGVKDPTKEYRVLKLKFSNDEGTFEKTVFEPRPEDFTRGETTYNDKNTGEEKKIPQPSGVENMMLLFKHAIDAINPTIAKQIDEGTKNLGAKDWNELRVLVSKILDQGKGAEVEIKLLTDSKGEAIFPGYFSGITKEGKAYIRNNFIGKNLAFSTYEVTRINTASTAKPNKVETFSSSSLVDSSAASQGDALDLDFEVPDLGI